MSMQENEEIRLADDLEDQTGETAPEPENSIGNIIERHLRRRSLLKGAAAAAPLFVLGNDGQQAEARVPDSFGRNRQDGLSFTPIEGDTTDSITVPDGYKADVVLRWGDPVEAGAPEFDFDNQSADAQAGQAGYNCDFIATFALPFRSELLWVNHEYTNPELMFAGYDRDNPTKEQVDIELNCHGGSVVELNKVFAGDGIRYVYNRASRFNRRITWTTEMELTGPAAGHSMMKTDEDATGTKVFGTFNNCGGGTTPWGTVLTAEENFNQYFGRVNDLPDSDERKERHLAFGIPGGESRRKWERFYDRFDVSANPNEPHRHGWVVEIDPYNPSFVPQKRTALGRFKHEAATTVVAADGRVVVYSGDDQRFEFMYKFVSTEPCDPSSRSANFGLLDDGVLYVAKFNDDGTGTWIPLVYGEGELTASNGFTDQGDVLIRTREAARISGATPMDRPEDFEVNPVSGKVYCALTNNTRRTAEAVDGVNPRGPNPFGHILEMSEDGNDHTATLFTWELFMLCGDPANPEHQTFFAGADPDGISKIANPDNVSFDSKGNLWIATDGQPRTVDINDGIYVAPTDGPNRGRNQQFCSAVPGAETASLRFSTDETALFISVQHPGEGGVVGEPISNFPDGGDADPRPTVVAVTRTRAPYNIGS